MNGTVKFFNTKKGFGFITAEDETDYFVHITGLGEDVQLNDGDAVTFDVEDSDRGPKAVNVSVVGSTSAASAEEDDSEAESTTEF